MFCPAATLLLPRNCSGAVWLRKRAGTDVVTVVTPYGLVSTVGATDHSTKFTTHVLFPRSFFFHENRPVYEIMR